jgi:hypothetical protein
MFVYAKEFMTNINKMLKNHLFQLMIKLILIFHITYKMTSKLCQQKLFYFILVIIFYNISVITCQVLDIMYEQCICHT